MRDKHLLFAILAIMFGMAIGAQAASYADRAWYWCQNNGHTEVGRDLKDGINMTAKKGALSYICWNADSWKFEGPSKATLDALDEATVDAWVADQKKDEIADKDMDLAIIKALVKVINLRPPDGEKISAAEMRAAIKAEL